MCYITFSPQENAHSKVPKTLLGLNKKLQLTRTLYPNEITLNRQKLHAQPYLALCKLTKVTNFHALTKGISYVHIFYRL